MAKRSFRARFWGMNMHKVIMVLGAFAEALMVVSRVCADLLGMDIHRSWAES